MVEAPTVEALAALEVLVVAVMAHLEQRVALLHLEQQILGVAAEAQVRIAPVKLGGLGS